MGFPGQTLSPILCWSSSLKYGELSDAHALSCFTDTKTPTEWKKLTT